MRFKLILLTFFALRSIHSQELVPIYFDFDQFSLKKNEMNKVQQVIKKNNGSQIQLFGYTDQTGSNQYNLKLASKRVNTVFDYLLDNGIDSSRIIKKIAHGKDSATYLTYKHQRKVLIEMYAPLIPTNELFSSRNENPITFDSIHKDDILVLKGFTFIPGRHIPIDSSLPKLNTLTNLLKENVNLKIEIIGHICCETEQFDGFDFDTGEHNLSVARAQYVYNHLINNGIHEERLSFKGLGRTQPLTKELNEAERQMNRRVEIKVVDL